jgi:hypothetical protein
MTKKTRKAPAGPRAKKEIPERYAAETALTPSATAVAAEALATGVMPLESQHHHPSDRTIPGEDELLRVGDADTRVTDAAFVGDETPGGDNPTPDQNQVDDMGRAMGVQEEDSGSLRSSSEILDRRDRHRGYLDVPEANPDTRKR